jgi:hypothetical protein
MSKRKGFSGFVVTGILRSGKRFKAIHTTNEMHAMCINLWQGSVWRSDNGKRKLLKRVWN